MKQLKKSSINFGIYLILKKNKMMILINLITFMMAGFILDYLRDISNRLHSIEERLKNMDKKD